mgnify:CR=1 FL=1
MYQKGDSDLYTPQITLTGELLKYLFHVTTFTTVWFFPVICWCEQLWNDMFFLGENHS